MSNFVIENGVLKEYKGIGGDVFIPNSVKTIGDWAFQGYTLLTSVTIPDSVTKIGSHAFDRCTSLTSVIIPNSVTYIAKCAFYNCSSLTSVTIPDSVTTIGDLVFQGCKRLKELILGKRVYPCDKSVSEEISSILRKIEEKNFSELPDNDLAHFFMWGYYKRTGDESALPYVGDFREELPPPEPEPQFDDIDSEEKFQALIESAMEEDNPSALPPLEKFSMYLTPQKVKEYLYLCVDKKSRKVSTLLWDYMETDSYILEDYKETKNKKFLAHIKEYFEKFMDSAIAQNDIEAVQKFAQEDGLFTAENIDEYLHKCIDKKKNQILMILLDYKENHFPE